MGATRSPHFALDGPLGLVVKKLRDRGASATQEALPARWVDLIHYLDRQERNSGKLRTQDAGTKPDPDECR